MNNVTAIVVVSLGSLLAVVAISFLRPDADNTVLIGLIFAAAVPTLTGLFGIVKSAQNSVAIVETKAEVLDAKAKIVNTEKKVVTLAKDVDGRLTQLIEARTESAHRGGVLQGEQDERDRSAPTPPGSTPPHGHPVALEAEKKLPKGKTKVGDQH